MTTEEINNIDVNELIYLGSTKEWIIPRENISMLKPYFLYKEYLLISNFCNSGIIVYDKNLNKIYKAVKTTIQTKNNKGEDITNVYLHQNHDIFEKKFNSLNIIHIELTEDIIHKKYKTILRQLKIKNILK